MKIKKTKVKMKKPLMTDSQLNSLWFNDHHRKLVKPDYRAAKRSRKEYLLEAIRAKTKVL